MKKDVSFLYVLLVCVITYALLFVGVPYFLHKPDLFSGFGVILPTILFVVVWVPIFIYFGIRKLISKKTEDNNLNKKSVGISFVIAALVFFFLGWLFFAN